MVASPAGLKALGVDFAERAIEQPRVKESKLEPAVQRMVSFEVGDGLHPSRLSRAPFGAVVDCGFFHVFAAAREESSCGRSFSGLDRRRPILSPGVCNRCSAPKRAQQVREDELRTLFAPEGGWSVVTVRPVKFITSRGEVFAVAACVERS